MGLLPKIHPENITPINFEQEHLFFSPLYKGMVAYDFLHSEKECKFLLRWNQMGCLSVCTQNLVASGKQKYLSGWRICSGWAVGAVAPFVLLPICVFQPLICRRGWKPSHRFEVALMVSHPCAST